MACESTALRARGHVSSSHTQHTRADGPHAPVRMPLLFNTLSRNRTLYMRSEAGLSWPQGGSTQPLVQSSTVAQETISLSFSDRPKARAWPGVSVSGTRRTPRIVA